MIAEMLRIDPSRASRVVADMVGRNVLRREASQADARRIVVVMTEVGQDLLAEIVAQKLAIISEIVSDWPQDDVERFAALFERFIGGYEAVFLSRDKDTPG
jgi:DNA-binding MarR family transcriptional regulator